MSSVSCNALNFGSPNNSNKFNGGDEWEESLNLYSTFFRGYDQQIGRFRGVDIMSEQTAGISNYQFSFNNPITFNDPLGNAAGSSDAANLLISLQTNPNAFPDLSNTSWTFDNGNLTSMTDIPENSVADLYNDLTGAGGGNTYSGGLNNPIYGGLYNTIVEFSIKAILKTKDNNKYQRAVEAMIEAYPDAFGVSKDYWYFNSTLNPTFSGFITSGPHSQNNPSDKSMLTIGQAGLDAFAKGDVPFSVIFRALYHEFDHIQDQHGINGHQLLDGNEFHNEREFLAYYNMLKGNPTWPRLPLSYKVDFMSQGLHYYNLLTPDRAELYTSQYQSLLRSLPVMPINISRTIQQPTSGKFKQCFCFMGQFINKVYLESFFSKSKFGE